MSKIQNYLTKCTSWLSEVKEKISDKFYIPYSITSKWEFIRYDIPHFFKNIWLFKKELSKYRWWDWSHSAAFFAKGLEYSAKNIKEKGYEQDITRLKSVAQMEHAASLLNRFIYSEHFYEDAEKELGLKYVYSTIHGDFLDSEISDIDQENNQKIRNRASEMHYEKWNELWQIMKGQDIKEWNPEKQSYDDWYDGSGLTNWWD